jgi:hypothetical protein
MTADTLTPGWDGGRKREGAGLAVLPAEDGARPDRLVLEMDDQPPSAKCGWCQYKVRTREHLFKRCPRWRPQQKILWPEMRRETDRGKDRFKIRDLLCGRTMQPVDLVLLLHYRRWEAGTESGGGRVVEQVVGAGGRGDW